MKVDKSKWNFLTIGDVCHVQFGTRIVKKNTEAGNFYVYGGGGATFTTKEFNREDAIVVSRFALSKECTRFINGKFFLNDSGLSLEPKNDLLLFNFLKWHIFALNDRIYSLARGAAQKNLDMKRFVKIIISLPKLNEQQSIASELAAIQTMIDGYKAQLDDLDELAKSIFLDMFGDPVENKKGWNQRKIGEICEVTSSKRIYQSEQTKIGVPFYRIGDFTKLIKDGVRNPELYISIEKYNELKEAGLVPLKNDILLTSRGTLGLSYIVTGNDRFYFQDGMITWLKNIHKEVLSIFIGFIFKASLYEEQIKKMQNGSTIAYLSISMIKAFKIIVPPIILQQRFAAKIEAIETQKEKYKAQLADAEQLMAERMQYYFS